MSDKNKCQKCGKEIDIYEGISDLKKGYFCSIYCVLKQTARFIAKDDYINYLESSILDLHGEIERLNEEIEWLKSGEIE